MAILSAQHANEQGSIEFSGLLPQKKTGNWELNLTEHRLSWSPDQYRLYGYEPQELVLNDEYFIINTTHASDIDRISATVHDALKNHESYNFKRRIIKKSGSLGFVQTNARIIRSKNGVPLKILGTTHDVEGANVEGVYDYSDPTFFNKFYKDYKKTIAAEIYKWTFDHDLSKDLCQEVFLKAWHHMSKFDPAKGSLYTWLINIARNHCKDYLGSKYFRYHQLTQSYEHIPDKALHRDNVDVEKLCVQELLFKLPLQQREIIDLIFVQGFTQKEVADLKTLPVGTVKTRSRSALKKLKEFIVAGNAVSSPAT